MKRLLQNLIREVIEEVFNKYIKSTYSINYRYAIKILDITGLSINQLGIKLSEVGWEGWECKGIIKDKETKKLFCILQTIHCKENSIRLVKFIE